VPIIIFGSSVIARILTRWPDSVFIGSYVLFAVAIQMVLKEPVIADWALATEAWVRAGLPWVVGLVITALQYKKAGRL
jgi:predicted tellurium resistance membrane protein TerC